MNAVASKLDANYTGMWVSFFTAAGIPSDVSATYALTFTENRIQNDMLLDLNKEYLRDMGITRMGDVIAILRHAKQVHENTARDRVLNSASARVPVATVTGRATLTQPSSPATRILEHYTRNTSAPEALKTTPSPQLKRKSNEIIHETDIDLKKARLIRFTPAPHSAPKEGTTKLIQGTSKTVFARLGNSEPAKVTTKAADKPIYARLGSKPTQQAAQDNQIMPMEKDALKYEGILKSAPPKKVVTITTAKNNIRTIAMGLCTMRADETPVSVKMKLALPKSVKFSNHVQYKEIEPLQSVVAKPQPKVIQKPVEKYTPVLNKPVQKYTPVFNKPVQKYTPVFNKPVQKYTPVFNKPERRLSMPEGVTSVKARLGAKSNANNLTITKNVFNRLGV